MPLGDGNSSDHLPVDEPVIELTDERYWLFAATNPGATESLEYDSYRANRRFHGIFLDLRENHDVDDAVVFVYPADWPTAPLHRRELQYQSEPHS